jgi:hypothetical protein
VTLSFGTGMRDSDGRRFFIFSGVFESNDGVNARCIRVVGGSPSSESLSEAARLGDLPPFVNETGAGIWDGV